MRLDVETLEKSSIERLAYRSESDVTMCRSMDIEYEDPCMTMHELQGAH